MVSVSLVCLSVGLLAPGPSPNTDAYVNAELAKLQGTWDFVALEVEGARVGEDVLRGARIVVKGDSFTTVGMGASYSGVLKVDAARIPKTLDLVFTDGPEKGNTSLAIYELDGDQWKLCLGFTGKERPQGFVTMPGSGHALETLKRAARDAGQEALPTELARLEGEWLMVSGENDGQPLPETFVKNARRIVKGNETTVAFGDQVFLKATITVDPSQKPRSIDYLVTEGTSKGQTIHGIYEWDGDNFRSCFSPPGKDRPTEFTTKAGDGRTLTAWKKKVDAPTERARP